MTTHVDEAATAFVLTTKLYTPPPRPDLISRPRLIARLQAGFQQSLTLICAPAGFGKSTLLSEWVHQQPNPSVWLSLDESDNEPAQFMRYFIAAIQTQHPDFGQEIVAVLQANQPPPLQSLFPRLLNAIHGLPQRFALVLDDYHLIDSQPIHSALTFLLLHMPPTLHLVISSRADPTIPLARLRVQGQLCELRVADLRFTRQEIVNFFQKRAVTPFRPEQVAVLEERTEGWAAGLQLAALSMAGRNEQHIDQFVAAFHGDHQYVVDYLLEEVLAQQRADVRDFLLQTSILDRLSAGLCDAVTEGQDSQAMLTELARVNLFLMPLDDQRHWYRYHQLFAEFLQQRLRQENPDLPAQLHRRAAAWYRSAARPDDAISHTLAAADWPTAAAMIEELAWQLRARGEYIRLRRWLDGFPKDFVYANPHLCRWYGFALVLSGEWQAAEKPLTIAVENVDEADNRLELAEILLTQMQIANFRKLGAVSVQLARRVLALLTADDQEMLISANYGLGRGMELLGDARQARAPIEEAERLSIRTNHLAMTLISGSTLGGIDQWQGRFRQAYARFRQCLERQTASGQTSISTVELRLGSLLYEWNRLEEAAHHLQAANAIAVRQRREHYWPVAYLYLARVYWAQGDLEAGQRASERAVALTRAVDNPEQLLQIEAYQARSWLSQGKQGMAAAWLEQYDLAADKLAQATPTECFQQQTLYLTWARWLLLEDRIDELLSVLQRLADVANAQGRDGDLIQIGCLQALAHQTAADMDQAQQILRAVLAQAAPEGYIRTFVDFGPQMATLLRHQSWPDDVADYVNTLLAAFEPVAAAVDTNDTDLARTIAPVNEILSERELEIMHLIANGLTAPQMAEELVISVHTMRTHLKNIYRKLEVNSRVQAVAKARALGLL